MEKPIASVALLLLLGGCSAAGGEYPLLLPRPIEQVSFAEPERTVPEIGADPALEVQIDTFARALDAAAAAFDARATQAQRLATSARGAASGSEAWIGAQIALSELDGLRSGTSSTLTEIERAAVDRASQGLPAYPALQRLIERAEARNRAEIDRIAAIEATLAPA